MAALERSSIAAPVAPYRHGELPGPSASIDMRRTLAATRLLALLAALGLPSVFLPIWSGRNVLQVFGCALILPILAFVAVVGGLSVRCAWRGAPPLRAERRALSVAVALLLVAELVLTRGGANLTTLSTALALPVAILPLGAVAAVMGWRCEGWEGWAYAISAIALAFAGSPYIGPLLAAARDSADLDECLGAYAQLTLVAGAVVLAAWAITPLAKAHDLGTYAGMGALGLAVDSLGMYALAGLEGVHRPEDAPVGRYLWWTSYLGVQHLLLIAAVALALPSILVASRRRYATAAGLVVVALLWAGAPLLAR